MSKITIDDLKTLIGDTMRSNKEEITKHQKGAEKLAVQNSEHITGQDIDDKETRIQRAKKDYAYFVKTYFSFYCEDIDTGKFIEPAPFHIKTAKAVLKNRNLKGIIEWHRGSAKSITFNLFLPLWLMINDELKFMLLIGKNNTNATKLLIDLQVELEYNELFIEDFGLQKNDGSWEKGAFITQQGIAFVALGMLQSPRGLRNKKYRPDYITGDDLDDDKLSKNPSRVLEVLNWLLRAVLPTMDKGRGRFFLINNRIAKNGILATIVNLRAKWFHSLINAFDKQGRVSWKSKYGKGEYFLQQKEDIGESAFQTEYMNNPISDNGDFKESWIQWKKPLTDWTKYDSLVCYCDPSFSTSPVSDFTAIKLWGKTGKEKHLLWAYVRQTETLEKALKKWWSFLQSQPVPVRDKIKNWIEAVANQDYLIKEKFDNVEEELNISLPIRYDRSQKPNKQDRIASMIADYENGHVYYNVDKKANIDFITAKLHLTAWSATSKTPDDSPDADKGAWMKIEKKRGKSKSLPRQNNFQRQGRTRGSRQGNNYYQGRR